MVSVQLIIMDALRPINESVPCVLNRSKSKPVAAEEENIFTMAAGINSVGKCSGPIIFFSSSDRKSKNPDALNIPTAVIRPTRVGSMSMTVKKPSFAPFKKS